MTALRIVSGGQTGVDRGALVAALSQGIACGGWCPAGRLAEDGVIPDSFPLEELPGGGYRDRTRKNVLDSDATLILINGLLEGGTAMTASDCRANKRPVLIVNAQELPIDAAARKALDFVRDNDVGTLNLAGPRASKWPGAEAYAESVVAGVIGLLQKTSA